MKIPELKCSSRAREYNSYSESQRSAVVKAWLFDGMTHREMDREILHLDSEHSHGFQSMGILHYIGLNKEFHGLFKGMAIEEAVRILEETGNPAYQEIIRILSDYNNVTEK